MAQVLYRGAALADGRSERLTTGISVLVDAGRIAWIRPADNEGPVDTKAALHVIDSAGATIVPGMVDAHSHVTLQGGAHWIERIDDPPETLLDVAEHNGRLLTSAGVRWARDVGSPRVLDPDTGVERALALRVREGWRDRAEMPYLRIAGTWLDRAGTLPQVVHSVPSATPEEFIDRARQQLDEGADLLKLYMDGPERGVSPWPRTDVAGVVELAHGRGARVTAHAANLDGTREAVAGGVDSIEHGDELDVDLAEDMARRGTFLVSTLAVYRSWQTFGSTTTLPRFASEAGRTEVAGRLERAEESVRLAHRAGVRICSGTDFGGGSLRANQLAWEVEALVAAGLEPWEALGAATWRGGELLGEPAAGTIAEGGRADFFLVHGDPLSDPAALWRVWRVAWLDAGGV